VVGGSLIPTIPPHLPISFSYIYIKTKSCPENNILTDSSTDSLSVRITAAQFMGNQEELSR